MQTEGVHIHHKKIMWYSNAAIMESNIVLCTWANNLIGHVNES